MTIQWDPSVQERQITTQEMKEMLPVIRKAFEVLGMNMKKWYRDDAVMLSPDDDLYQAQVYFRCSSFPMCRIWFGLERKENGKWYIDLFSMKYDENLGDYITEEGVTSIV
jgi:hypothetical protein